MPWAVLWLLGLVLRVTVVALAPLLPAIAHDLRLDQTAIGVVTTLPVLLFGLGAAIGATVIGRLGIKHAVLAGLSLEAIGGALRGASTSMAMLFGCTFVMGLGIAILQPALPTLVRRWKAGRVGAATAVYGNGLLCGEAMAASLTVPFVLTATGSWQASIALWSAPVGIALVVSAVALTRGEPSARALASERASVDATPLTAPAVASVWPRLREGHVWRLGLIQGGASTAYFAANGFLPGVLHASGHGGLVGPALTVLNVSQLPASLLLVVHADHLVRRRWTLPLVSVGLAGVAAGLLVASTPALLVLAGLLGFLSALLLLLALALPAATAQEREVAPISAGMFTVGYTMAFALPLAGGALADATGSLRVTLAPALVGSLLATMASASLQRPGRRRRAPASASPASVGSSALPRGQFFAIAGWALPYGGWPPRTWLPCRDDEDSDTIPGDIGMVTGAGRLRRGFVSWTRGNGMVRQLPAVDPIGTIRSGQGR